MSESHLTPEQVVAVRDEAIRDSEVLSHLRTCPECQARLRESRVLGVLLTPPESTTSPHPEPEDLAAYAEETLPDRDAKPLAAHVAGCPQCFAELEAIQAHLQPGQLTVGPT